LLKYLLLCCLFTLGLNLGAQETPAPAPADPYGADQKTMLLDNTANPEGRDIVPVPSDIGIWDILRMFLVLGLVVAMIYGFVFIIRKFTVKPAEKFDGVKLLATFSLSNTRVLYFVEISTRILVLSGAENGVNFITEMDDKEWADSMRLQSSKVSPKPEYFSALIERFFPKKPITPNNLTNVEYSSDFLKKQRDRVQNIKKL